jgi:hypothetical protein
MLLSLIFFKENFMGQRGGIVVILTAIFLTSSANYAKALTFGEALGIGAGAVLIDRAVRNNNNQRYRFVPPEQEFQRGLEDGFNFARYDNPRNSRDYDDGFIEGRRRRESGWASPNRR